VRKASDSPNPCAKANASAEHAPADDGQADEPKGAGYRRGGMRKRTMGTIAGLGLGGACAATAGAAIMAASPATTGCTTHQCDPSTTDVYPFMADPVPPAMDDAGCMDDAGDVGPRDFMIDENTFVTTRLDGRWLNFPGNGTLRIWFPPEVAGRTPLAPTALVGIGPCADGQFARDSGVNFAPAAGSLSEFNDVNTRFTTTDAGNFGGSFEVTNVTCQFYYGYFQVSFAALDAMAPPDDASAEAGADAEAATTSPDGATADGPTE
jgi:hypothetical protein